VIFRRFLRSSVLPRRSFLSVIVLPDEAAAFQAYRLLQAQGISPEHLAIVGHGYSSPDRVGLQEPLQIALRRACQLGQFAAILGIVMGVLVLVIVVWGLEVAWTSYHNLVLPVATLGSGLVGAIAGAMMGFFGEGSTSGIFRHHLRQGRYLLMIEGPERLVRTGQDLLSQYAVSRPSWANGD